MSDWDEPQELNDYTRKGVEGSFITLGNGITHYQLSDDKNGIPIVLVHGFSVPHFVFDPTFEYLSRSGFQVLRYDLFGRGFSDRPWVDYDLHLFVQQLKDLLDALNFTKIHLLGLSMGGPITAAFIEKYPSAVMSHIMIDPSGIQPLRFSRLLRAATLPIVGELLLGLFGSENMVRNIASDLFTPELVEVFQEKYRVQMQFRGFKRAILSTVRKRMLGSFLDVYEQVGKRAKPTLVFWGRQDAAVPLKHSADLLKVIPHAELQVIENCGHIPHYERPGEVHPILLEFLRRNQS